VTADGNSLIVDNTVLDKLFTVNSVTGASALINVAGLIPNSMDGLLLQGASPITATITSPLFDDPTTVAKYRDHLALPDGQ
jgi:hypothetical protein